MTLIMVIILLLGYLLIATENVTKINKVAVAVFMGTLCWVLYICYGTDYVMSRHQTDYFDFLNGAGATSVAVKCYIAKNIFIGYVGKASEIVLFLLATMPIVEILNNNGCFDFLSRLLRTRSSKKLLWFLSVITFILSANLDNLSTTVLMLTLVHNLVVNRKQRMYYGSAVLISANCGGAFTVIGDPIGLVLWNNGHVSATNFSLLLFIPCLIAWFVPIFLMGRALPEYADIEWQGMPYRGDDTRLNVWQRLVMFVVGIGGLWFIPTFHNITKLSPFLGALCVLALLWIVNEIFNRKLMNADDMIHRRMPRVLQYGVLQMIFFVLGMMLALGAIQEIGATEWLMNKISPFIENEFILGVIVAFFSVFLDGFATALSFISLNSSVALNHSYWAVVAYAAAMGGNILLISSVSGLALIKAEHIKISWYFRNVGFKALIGVILGMIALYIMI